MTLSYRLIPERTADGVYVAKVGFRPPFVTDEGGSINLNVTYEYCPPEEDGRRPRGYSEHYNTNDADDSEKQTEREDTMKGAGDENDDQEADAAPGENIRFRFIALNSRQLQPTTEESKWPKFRVDRQDYFDPKFVEVAEDERHQRQASPQFDVIYVEDPSGNRVKEWRHVSQMTALNLSFSLLSDASEGVLLLVAKVPKEVDINAEKTHFNVGASYTNGNSFQGHYDAQICVCSGMELRRQQQSLGVPFDNDMCPSGPYSRRPASQCLRVAGSLSGTPEKGGCARGRANVKSLMQQAGGRYGWGSQVVGFIVTITEADTRSAVIQFGQAEIRRFRARKLSLEIDRAYHPGLPIYGRVRLNEMNTVAMGSPTRVNLRISEILNHCGTWYGGGDSFNPDIYSRQLTLNSDGVASFILPPVNSRRELQVKVALLRDETISATAATITPSTTITTATTTATPNTAADTNNTATTTPATNTPPPPPQHIIPPFWQPHESHAEVYTSESLRRWRSLGSLALKVRSINGDSPVHCPGSLNLTIMASAPLAGKTLFLEYLSRGVPTQRSAVLQSASSSYACLNEDSDLGHYTCNAGFKPGEVGEISCLRGWTGENCLTRCDRDGF
nr:unnamed protein product [Spirometra erinaceieuropaei]